MARDFSGSTSNFLSIGDVSAIDITGTALTVSAWVFPDNFADFRSVAVKATSTGLNTRQYGIYLAQTTGVATFLVGDAAGQDTIATPGAVSTAGWSHVAGRKNGTGVTALSIFLNGVGTSGTSNKTIQNRADSLNIGRFSDALLPFDGRIAEVAIWNLALTDTEIGYLADGASPLTIQAANLKGYWPIYGLASPEPDRSGSGNNATINGSVPASGTHIPEEIVLQSETSTQSLNEVDDPRNSQISTQTLLTSEEEVVTCSQTSTQTNADSVGNPETVSNSSTSTQDFGRIEIPVLRIIRDGIDPGLYYLADGIEVLVDNADERTILEIVSISGVSKDVTFVTTYEQDELHLQDRVVTIPAGSTRFVGAFPAYIYNSEITDLYFDQQTPGSLKFRAFSLTS